MSSSTEFKALAVSYMHAVLKKIWMKKQSSNEVQLGCSR